MEHAPLPTRQRQRRDTRNLILEVALTEIAENGLAQARIEHIARKAGVSRPTIYAHFPRKEDFLLALQARTEAAALHAIQQRIGASGSGDLVHGLLDVIFDLLEVADPVLRRESFALMIREPQQIDWGGNALFAFLTERIEAARTRGEISVPIEPAELTRIAMTAIFGFLVVESEPLDSRRRAAHRMLDLLIGGART